MLGVGLPEPVRREGGQAAEALLVRAQRRELAGVALQDADVPVRVAAQARCRACLWRRLVDLAVAEQSPDVGGRCDLARLAAHLVQVGGKHGVGAEQRVQRERANHVG